MSKRKPATRNDLRELVQWMGGNDCGLSSMTIACVMAGTACDRPFTPLDDDDFGRCHRLLKRFPQFQERLGEVADAHPEWRPIIADWPALENAHEAGNRKEVQQILMTAHDKARTRTTGAA